jgi:hypothetical protein
VNSSWTTVAPRALLFAFLGCWGCGGGPTPAPAALRFDACGALSLAPDADATADQIDGITLAASLWNARAGARLAIGSTTQPTTTNDATPTVPVHFQSAAGAFHGFYDPHSGEVFVNLDLAGRERAVTIAHEVGHAFGLPHVSAYASVMNPGNLTVEPNADDVAALAALWGTCAF